LLGAQPHHMAREKGMSCRRLYTEIAKRAPVKMTAVEAREFLRSVSDVIAKNVAPQNVVRIPQLATFRVRFNNPRPERTRRIGTGNEFVVAARPVTQVLKATVAHDLQTAVRKKQVAKKRIARNPAADEEIPKTQLDSCDDID
jgi:nucleoid DNA-binding protein